MTNTRKTMNHGSLFSGIGGFDLAAAWMGWNNVFSCEKDEWCNKVLAKNFPNTERHLNIKDFNAKKYNGTIDIISGGFPCQPFSVAGQRKGKADDRYLWEEMLRIINEAKPAFVVGENVTGIIGMALDTVLSDLEAQDYTTETFIIPACSKNAWHRRDRVWIVAYANRIGWYNEQKESIKSISDEKRNDTTKEQSRREQQCRISEPGIIFPNPDSFGRWRESQIGMCEKGTRSKSDRQSKRIANVTDTDNAGCKEQRKSITDGTKFFAPKCSSWWETEPGVGRVVDGLSGRVDRLKGLGNAIVPQIAYEIFRSIAELQHLYNENSDCSK
jgi:DNA (cytosine-5)-methyltransferase 1